MGYLRGTHLGAVPGTWTCSPCNVSCRSFAFCGHDGAPTAVNTVVLGFRTTRRKDTHTRSLKYDLPAIVLIRQISFSVAEGSLRVSIKKIK